MSYVDKFSKLSDFTTNLANVCRTNAMKCAPYTVLEDLRRFAKIPKNKPTKTQWGRLNEMKEKFKSRSQFLVSSDCSIKKAGLSTVTYSIFPSAANLLSVGTKTTSPTPTLNFSSPAYIVPLPLVT